MKKIGLSILAIAVIACGSSSGVERGSRAAGELACVERGGFLMPHDPSQDVFLCRLPSGKKVDVMSLI